MFVIEQFWFRLKGGLIFEKEYEAVKKLYLTLKLENLGELNKLYNFQDTIILCENFESRAAHLQKIFKFNAQKCNSASSFSGCVHRDKSKCFIALPTNSEKVKLLKQTLIGGLVVKLIKVIKLIKTLDVKKASQKSDIPTRIVKLNADFF